MPKVCSICQHPERTAIDASLGKDGPNATARAFGIAKTSLLRHRDAGHVAGVQSTTAPAAPPPSSSSHWTAPPPTSRTPVLAVTPAPTRAPTFTGRPTAGRQCKTCGSPARADIEAELLAGTPRWRIARDVPGAPSVDSIDHHARRCIPDLIRHALAETGAKGALTIGHRIVEMVDGVMSALQDVEAAASKVRELYEAPAAGACSACGTSPDAADRHRLMVTTAKATAEIARKAVSVLALAGKFTGEIRERVEVDIRTAKDWPAFTAAIGEAVADCDACSHRVEEALRGLHEGA